MDAQTDDWALLALAPDDATALRLLFERHRHFVYRVAWGVLTEDALADDVVQEVFLGIGSGCIRGNPRARFTTWLYRVAINTSRAQARKRRRVWGDAAAEIALAATEDVGASPLRLDRRKDLGRALAALPIRQREVVILRFLEGFDTAETARILGCRDGTVKAHLHRATQTLRTFLGEDRE